MVFALKTHNPLPLYSLILILANAGPYLKNLPNPVGHPTWVLYPGVKCLKGITVFSILNKKNYEYNNSKSILQDENENPDSSPCDCYSWI